MTMEVYSMCPVVNKKQLLFNSDFVESLPIFSFLLYDRIYPPTGPNLARSMIHGLLEFQRWRLCLAVGESLHVCLVSPSYTVSDGPTKNLLLTIERS